MILGIGTDLVKIDRIKAVYDNHGQRFLNKIFTENERFFCQKRVDFIASFSKMFAIKEASGKAIGDMRGIGWHDIEVFHNNLGKPYVILHNNACKKIPITSKIEVSVSDEKEYAVAFVIIFK